MAIKNSGRWLLWATTFVALGYCAFQWIAVAPFPAVRANTPLFLWATLGPIVPLLGVLATYRGALRWASVLNLLSIGNVVGYMYLLPLASLVLAVWDLVVWRSQRHSQEPALTTAD